MHRKRSLSAILGLSSLGLMVWFLGATGAASGQVKTHAAANVTVIAVTVGKPTELGFKLSKFSALPAGTITFNVKNAGVGTHNFKICTTPVASAAKNSCVGKATKMLKTGESTTLTVTITKGGKYEFLCSVPGHASAGMKGLLGVGLKLTAADSASASSTVSNTSTSTGTKTSTGGAGAAGGGAGDTGCPAGTTIVQGAAANGGDHDDDDLGGADDGDGCI